MGDKRDATIAGLPWPTPDRTSSNLRTTGSTDSDMIDDIGHETFAPLAPATLPSDTPLPSTNSIPPPSATSYNHYHDYTHYGPWTPSTTPFWQTPSPAYPRDRTVHTIYFKIWDPDSPARSLYVEEINQQGIVRQFDPEHFFHKLTGDHVQANQMSDYWRSHYGLPLKHGGTPHHPTWASRVKSDLQPQRGTRVKTRPIYVCEEDCMVPLTVRVLLWAKEVQGTSSRTRPVDHCSWASAACGKLAWFIFIGDRVVSASNRCCLQN